jgi:hypothetical protein
MRVDAYGFVLTTEATSASATAGLIKKHPNDPSSTYTPHQLSHEPDRSHRALSSDNSDARQQLHSSVQERSSADGDHDSRHHQHESSEHPDHQGRRLQEDQQLSIHTLDSLDLEGSHTTTEATTNTHSLRSSSQQQQQHLRTSSSLHPPHTSLTPDPRIKSTESTWLAILKSATTSTVSATTLKSRTSKLKKLCRQGIPNSCRGAAWSYMAGVDRRWREGVYEELVERCNATDVHAKDKITTCVDNDIDVNARHERMSASATPPPAVAPLTIPEDVKNAFDVIEKDVGRCFPDHIMFHDPNGDG